MNGLMIGNNTGIRRRFDTMAEKFDRIYCQRTGVHWIVGEGTESGEIPEARENLGFLQKDLEDVKDSFDRYYIDTDI